MTIPEPRIEDFALIGDCETAALVGRDGSIGWLCWPRFDSEACFTALLGEPEHGCWRISPSEGAIRASRRYRDSTLILETLFETDDGAVTLIDFMPPRGKASDIVRIVRGERGSVAMRMDLTIRFGFGQTIPWVSRMDDGTLRAIAGPDMVVLRTPAEFRGEDMKTVAEFTVAAGETVPFVLTYGPSHEPVPAPIDHAVALEETEAFWTEWAGRYQPTALNGHTPLPEAWHEAIRRSLITLKALTYAPTGGIVAAPTTSLPEEIGGSRNWDYRFCWLRDSSFTLFAFMNGGYFEEAKAWRDWLLRAVAGSTDQMQIMYGIGGERRLTEWEADWLPGFAGSRPVRIGNAAHEQLQIDVYGEVMSLLHQGRVGGLPELPEAWALQQQLLVHLEKVWREPDEGIWEVRGPPRHFTFSKVMAWVAFDRCIRSVEQFALHDGPVDHWRAIRDEIHQDVCQHGFDIKRGCFVQAYGETQLDASLLLLASVGFLPPDDPRIAATIAAIEEDLLVDGFVQRYRPSEQVDGQIGTEGAFLACSFWLVTARIRVGRIDEARALFERLLTIRNDLGLLAEEYDPKAGRQLGNFPQAFSHISLVNAGHRLAQAMAGKTPAQEPGGAETGGAAAASAATPRTASIAQS